PRRNRAARWLGRARGGAQPDVARRRSRRDRRNGARAPVGDPGPGRRDLAAPDRREELLSNERKKDSRADCAGRGRLQCKYSKLIPPKPKRRSALSKSGVPEARPKRCALPTTPSPAFAR